MKTAKELARELGLIRKRTFNHTSHETKNQRSLAQQFSYLIVIDFESTCWKDRRNSDQEIIEFPAVLMNTSTGEIESEYQMYCLPEENPALSKFCTELTGITQEQVESGIPLFLCLKKFSRWLKKLETDKNIAYNSSNDQDKQLCTFVTWSDWDLGICLHHECRRKQLPKPEALRCWIDLRATYRKFYQRIPKGLEGALKDLGIEFKGRQHSGLDDAKNTAYLAWRMIRDGCVMKITRSGPLPNSKGQSNKMTNDSTIVKQLSLKDKTISGSSLNSQSLKSNCKIKTAAEAQIFPTADKQNVHVPINSEQSKTVAAKGATDNEQQIESQLSNRKRFGVYPGSTECSLHQFTKRNKNIGVVNSVKRNNCLFTNPAMSVDETKLSSSLQSPLSSVNGSGSRVQETEDVSVVTMEKTIRGVPVVSSETTFKTPNVKGPLPTKRIISHSTISKGVYKQPAANLRNCKSANTTPNSRHLTKPSSYTRLLSPSAFRTPLANSKDIHFAKITPPLCGCGKRSRRKTVFSPGPNQGRPYYSCCGRRQSKRPGLSDATNYQGGCNYFKWESLIIKNLKTPKSSFVGNAFIKCAGHSSSI